MLDSQILRKMTGFVFRGEQREVKQTFRFANSVKLLLCFQVNHENIHSDSENFHPDTKMFR
jgi:hypothetical protein